jgi:hypothetical protein
VAVFQGLDMAVVPAPGQPAFPQMAAALILAGGGNRAKYIGRHPGQGAQPLTVRAFTAAAETGFGSAVHQLDGIVLIQFDDCGIERFNHVGF